MTENEIATHVVDAAYKIHTTLGPGLLESVYEAVLAYVLMQRGLRVVRQQAIPIVYEGIHMEAGFRADLIVEDKVIIEIKSVETVLPFIRSSFSPISAWPASVWVCSSTSTPN